MSWKDGLKFIGHRQTKNFGSTLETHLLHPPEGLLFFVLFSFKAEIHSFTVGILEILNLCFGAKSSNSKADCTAAILFPSSGNKHCSDLFFLIVCLILTICDMFPGCLNPPHTLFYLSKEFWRAKLEKTVFPGWKTRQYFWTRKVWEVISSFCKGSNSCL